MATPAIGGVVSSETGTVSLTAVPVGGWMLAALVGADGIPATPSGWTSYGADVAGWGIRVVGRVKQAGDTTLTSSGTSLVSVMWGTGAGTVWRSATGGTGSTSLSLSGTTAGSRLVTVAPYLPAFLLDEGYATGGAVTDHTLVAYGSSKCWWSAGTAAGGTATATRSTPGNPGVIQYAGPWVLVEIL